MNFRRQFRCHCGQGAVFHFRHMPCRACRIRPQLPLQSQVAHDVSALPQRRFLADHGRDGGQCCAGNCHQLMPHAQEVLPQDVKRRVGKQIVNIGYSAMQRVLDRYEAEINRTFTNPRKRIFESRRGNRFAMGHGFACCEMRVRTWLALKHHFACLADESDVRHPCCKIPFARSRSSGVSTDSGTSSMRAISICIPASTARNCSSFSRASNGETGSETNRARAVRRNA